MLSRRAFLGQAAGATVTLVLTPIVTGACSSSSGNGGGMPSSSTNPTQPAGCDGVEETSTLVESHVHTVCVPARDLTSPPASGATYTTSSTSSHTHAVSLSAAQLVAIEAGSTVTVTSSNVVDPVNGALHAHDFTIRKST